MKRSRPTRVELWMAFGILAIFVTGTSQRVLYQEKQTKRWSKNTIKLCNKQLSSKNVLRMGIIDSFKNSPMLLFNVRLISNKQQVYHYETLHNALALKYSKHTIHTRRSHEDINVIKKRSWHRSRSWCSDKKHRGKSTNEWAHFNLLRLVGFCPHIWNSSVKFSQGQQEENRTLLILHTSLPTSYDFRFFLRLKGFTTQVMTTSPIKWHKSYKKIRF